jgi:ketosteroid isomerase-like protein
LNACNESSSNEKKEQHPQEALIRSYFEEFNQHHWKQMASYYIDQAVFLDPSLGSQAIIQTHVQIIAKYQALETMLPDIRDSIVSMNSSGQTQVTVEFISLATLPDQKKMYLPICTVFTFNSEGKITADHTYYDNTSN